ncbi:MAG TPA: hypothetical protein PLZ75_02440 [Bacteroidales bacterium]|nr:hypothetical protein [Bacteroidales bacterium]HQH23949.1 hypothetical protein [Bacteroidales bacterium]HQJ81279.1 hypothetical protein [Bacteroidales bacterium]
MKRSGIILIILVFTFTDQVLAQKIDSLTFSLNTRYSFYSFEDNAEIILHIPPAHTSDRLAVLVTLANGDTVCTWSGTARNRLVRIPFKITTGKGFHRLNAEIHAAGTTTRFIAKTLLLHLDYKPNEVKTDRLTGGLIVNKRQFFPAGFYCYSPVHPSLPEEEAVRGFNMISPYQKILPSSFPERKAYMDRCAQLGMKVHYNLLSVAGGGGVASQLEGITAAGKKALLLNEIKSFRDHPALLAWYIADEPNGYRIPPDTIRAIYELIRENDPWHPVSVVFMAPFTDARKYINALDIVMADPYPIPVSPVTLPGNVAKTLSNEFRGRRPVWMVPQAFGGGELWSREPTVQEVRAMTYQSIINGAKGIQYFVREGLNLFPKSTALWNECGKMAVEIAEMTPWLLSDEASVAVSSGSENIMLASFAHRGQLMILAANRTNMPVRADFSLASPLSGRARVIFENRFVTLKDGKFNDQLSALGTQVYLFNLLTVKENVKPFKGNLITDPGFEDLSSPGIPASCYAWNNGDRGATFFLDSREHVEGNHSLRLITPADNRSARLRFFPFRTSPGKTYYISVMAKTDPEIITDNPVTGSPLYFEISLGNYGSRRFALSSEWKEYVAAITIPYGNNIPPKTNVILQLPSAGVAWFDMLQAIEGVDVNRSINPELLFIRE